MIGAAPISTTLYRSTCRASGPPAGTVDLPGHLGEMEVERELSAPGRAQPRGGAGAVLLRRGRLSPPCAGQRRPHHPALGISYLLHALSAGDRPGHAAVPVRVPDPGRGPDRHGGGQRLHVRRLHRGGRGGDDGRPRHPPVQGGAVRRPASPLRRDHPRPWPMWPASRSCARPPPSTPRRRSIGAIDADTACVVVQTPNVFGTATDVDRHRRGRPRRRRAAGRGDHRGGLASACSSRPARWARTSPRPRASPSATA